MSRKQIWIAWVVFIVFVLALSIFYSFRTVTVSNSPPAGPKKLLAIGDEYILGRGASQTENSMAHLVAKKLGWEIDVVAKEKISSIDIRDILIANQVFEKRYGIALVVVGRNDEYFNLPNETSLNRMEFIFGSLLSVGTMVVYASVELEPSNWRASMVKALARNMGVLVLDDIVETLQKNGNLLTEDSYPNDAGHAFLADLIYKDIESNL